MQFDEIRDHDVAHGENISTLLDQLARFQLPPWEDDFRESIAGGVAFVTFAFDIDGVSMEVAKYAQSFEAIVPGIPIHCIAGNFGGKADAVLDPLGTTRTGRGGWVGQVGRRRLVPEIVLRGSDPEQRTSTALATEMWNQALALAERLIAYIDEHSNPHALQRQHQLEPGQRRARARARARRRIHRCRRHQQQPRLLLGGRQGRMQTESGRGAGPPRPFLPQPRQRGVLRVLPADLPLERPPMGAGQHQHPSEPSLDRPLPLPSRARVHDRDRARPGLLPGELPRHPPPMPTRDEPCARRRAGHLGDTGRSVRR